MIHDEIVTYEVAKLAKEKGFNVPIDRYYHIYDDVIEVRYSLEMTSDGCADFYNSLNRCRCAAPTQSLLQRWLRDYGFGEAEVRHWPETNKYPHHYGWEVKDNLGDLMSFSSKMFDTYEQALEDALKYTLENLV